MFLCKKLVILCFLFPICVFSAPLEEHVDGVELTDEQIIEFDGDKVVNTTALISKYKWPRNANTQFIHVPIVIWKKDYSEEELEVFHKTCIRFVNLNKQENYIQILNTGKGKCCSNYGRIGGKQRIQLTPECMKIRKKCVHEILHSLGLHHVATKEFSKNGEDTIIPKDVAYLDIVGKQLTFSDGDATRINRTYKCPAPYK